MKKRYFACFFTLVMTLSILVANEAFANCKCECQHQNTKKVMVIQSNPYKRLLRGMDVDKIKAKWVEDCKKMTIQDLDLSELKLYNQLKKLKPGVCRITFEFVDDVMSLEKIAIICDDEFKVIKTKGKTVLLKKLNK